MTEKIPIIFDTDIGSDIDDAVALAYLLAEPRCDLLGITTVSGEAIQRARMASALCIAAGKPDIPIHCGAMMPIYGPQKQPHSPQAEALDNWPHIKDFEPGAAIDWMRRTIRERPGEITLLAVGPMTNIGLLFTVDPEIPKLLKSIVLMCGLFTTHIPWSWPIGTCEWNALNDPVATSIVYGAGAQTPSHISYGLDVTMWCRMAADEVRAKFHGPVLDVVRSFAEVWFRHSEDLVFHDPLAAVSIFEPEICKYHEGLVTVELASEALKGMTRFSSDTDIKPHKVAAEVDSKRFFDRYFRTVAG